MRYLVKVIDNSNPYGEQTVAAMVIESETPPVLSVLCEPAQ